MAEAAARAISEQKPPESALDAENQQIAAVGEHQEHHGDASEPDGDRTRGRAARKQQAGQADRDQRRVRKISR
ncbi:hypothetical protein D0Q02_06720 [Micromonospora craniellae]|uniref:Uncharacterized protein n=1 Tax=Micromonospora craniellae TaxID=2294034 RepID=A0A372G2G2_9ACTN|nr:hypothetical protein D0Q02_06720 [Micromonospora craniellae]